MNCDAEWCYDLAGRGHAGEPDEKTHGPTRRGACCANGLTPSVVAHLRSARINPFATRLTNGYQKIGPPRFNPTSAGINLPTK